MRFNSRRDLPKYTKDDFSDGRFSAELKEREKHFSLLVKAECRYVYSGVPVDTISEQTGLTGEEIRDHVLSRGHALRCRWKEQYGWEP